LQYLHSQGIDGGFGTGRTTRARDGVPGGVTPGTRGGAGMVVVVKLF